MASTQMQHNISHRFDSMARNDWATIRRKFQRFTTPAAACETLRTYLPGLSGSAYEISECTILDAKLKKYLKPSSMHKSTLSVCYQFTVREASADMALRHIFYVKAFLGNRSTEAFHHLSHENEHDQEFRQHVAHVPEQDMIVWRFPYDPALPHLRQLTELGSVGTLLPTNSLTQLGMSGTPCVLSSHVVNYRPEIRCTNRYDLYDQKQSCTYQIFGKTFRGGEGQSLSQRQHYFWNRSLADPDAMAVAHPLGHTVSTDTVWQLGVPGTPLLQVLDASNYEEHSAATAKGLASLHTSHITNLATHAPADHVTEVRKKLVKLSDAVPHLATRCAALANQIERTAPHPSTIPSRPIHWDFHIDQLLTYQGRLVFCDLDELVSGDPLQDLANFIVDLHFRPVDVQLIRFIAADLYDTYRRLVEWGVSVKRLTWHARIQFINKAYRHYLRFAPGFEQAVEQIIQMAEKELSIW
ncbi:MAG: aminoglycoside phosphotransferase family protein [Nitrospira sp.]